MKETAYNILFISLISVCLFSCKKYLEKKPTNFFVVPETAEDLQKLLDDNDKMNLLLTPCLGEASADDHFILQATYDPRLDREKDMYRWIPTDYTFKNDWSRGYEVIYNANYCLELLNSISLQTSDESTWNNVKGSALFYRAYNFLNLTWNYAKAYDESASNTDLGIALRLGSDFNVSSNRATVRECYDRVIADAKESINFLPDIPTHTFRPSKAAAFGLLARTFLSMRQYDSAYKYANLCLQIKSDIINCNGGDAHFSGASASFPFVRFNKETIFYSEMNFETTSTIHVTRAKVDTALYLSYPTNDIRRAAFFGTPTTTPTGKTVYRFKGSYSQSGNYFTGIATDEIYLIKAECLARGVNGVAGDKDAALAVLNTLLSRRYNSTFTGMTAPSAEAALNIILLERRKELLMRGLRWIDIKRLNKEDRNISLTRIISGQTYNLQPNANYYALPLPTDIINLTGMPQNPM